MYSLRYTFASFKSYYFRSLAFQCPITADAWRRFSVLRLRQKNGAKRLLPAGLFLAIIHFFLKFYLFSFAIPKFVSLNSQFLTAHHKS